MTIEKSRQGETLELKVIGWLDTDASTALAAEIAAIDDTVTALVIDCASLEFISSAGMRQLVAAHKRMDGAMTLRNVSEDIMSIISMTGLSKKLHIEA